MAARILVVAPDLPHPPFTGAHTRPLSLIRALARHHEVVAVGAAAPGADLAPLEELCLAVGRLRAEPYRRGAARSVLSAARRGFTPVPLIGRSYSASLARLVASAVERFSPAVPSHEMTASAELWQDAAPLAACDQPKTSGSSVRRCWRRLRATLSGVRIEYIYLVIVLAWGLAQVFIVPPLQVPDEEAHWYRSWAITDGQLTADAQGMLTLPAYFRPIYQLVNRIEDPGGSPLPVSLVGQPGFTTYRALFNQTELRGTVRVDSHVRRYSPIGYLPQAVGIGLGRVVGASPLTCFYMARIMNLLVAVALFFFAIRLAPFGKQLYAFLALLPMTMFELTSVACDALTLAGAFFFTALVLNLSRRDVLRTADIVSLLVAAALFLNVKPGYWALIFLLLLIRPRQIGGAVKYWCFVASGLAVVVAVFLLVLLSTSTVSADLTASAAGAGVSGQAPFILHHPLGFASVLWENVSATMMGWVEQSIGLLGWLQIPLPQTFYLFVLVVGLKFFMGMDEKLTLQTWRRLLLGAVGVAMFLTLAISVYVFLEPVGSARVFLQGRYLAPIWLLLMLSVYGIRLVQQHWRVIFIAAVFLLMLAQNFHTLMAYYR